MAASAWVAARGGDLFRGRADGPVGGRARARFRRSEVCSVLGPVDSATHQAIPELRRRRQDGPDGRSEDRGPSRNGNYVSIRVSVAVVRVARPPRRVPAHHPQGPVGWVLRTDHGRRSRAGPPGWLVPPTAQHPPSSSRAWERQAQAETAPPPRLALDLDPSAMTPDDPMRD